MAKKGKTLRAARIAVQVVVFTVITWALMAWPTALAALVVDNIEAWMLIPASLLGAMSVAGVWIMVTLVFGRIYCSTVCPVGTMQDISARIYGIVRRKKKIYRYDAGRPWYVRAAMLSILVMTVIMGSVAVSWSLMPFLQVSPVNSYMDMVALTERPIAGLINNIEGMPSSYRIIISAVINLVFILTMGALRGRDLCNSLCPLGSALGILGGMAMMRMDIDTDKCTHCRRCEQVCKCSCVDSEAGTVDMTRCVACFDCTAVCPDGAMRYTTHRHSLSTPMLMKINPG